MRIPPPRLTDHAVIRRSQRHGQIERRRWSRPEGGASASPTRRRTRRRRLPRSSFPDDAGRERAAVEEDGVGTGRSVVGRDPPKRSDCSALCRRRKAARCLGIAGSATNGRPNSWRPVFPPLTGSASSPLTRGKKPSRTIDRTSSRVSSDWRLPPISFEPRPAIVTGQRSRGVLAQELLLGRPARENRRADHCSLSSRTPPSFSSTLWARARSMLSPPSIRWSPTATRRNPGPVGVSTTVIRLKSVVPPPMSQTRISSPARTSFCQPSVMRQDPAVEGGLRLLQQNVSAG